MRFMSIGLLAFALFGCSVNETQRPTDPPTVPAADIVEATETEVGAWSRFEDEDLGVAFDYPTGYIEVGCAPERSASALGGSDLRVGHRIVLHVEDSPTEDPQQASAAFLDHRNSVNTDATFVLVQETPSILGGQPAVRLEYRFGGTGRFGESTFAVYNQRLYRLDFTAGDFCDLPETGMFEGQVFERVVASLQFLD
jgi:hypothetical protein